jgi:Cu-processing system permease protein
MRNVLIVARKEIQEGLRNRWVLATTLLLAALALTLSFLGSAPTGSVGMRALDVVIVSLSSLTIFLLPLIALLISHDAIIGEMERGTMLLLLSYPVGRWQVLLGKFVGHFAILGFATLLGYGAAAGALVASGAVIDLESWTAFIAMVGSSVLLGAVFIAVGYLVSALVRDRGTAAGIAVGIWLVFVLIYDMAFLGPSCRGRTSTRSSRRSQESGADSGQSASDQTCLRDRAECANRAWRSRSAPSSSNSHCDGWLCPPRPRRRDARRAPHQDTLGKRLL